MAAEYQVKIANASGTLQYWVDDYAALRFTKQRNGIGYAMLSINGDDEIADNLADDWQIEIRRKDDANGIDWHTEFDGLWVDYEHRGDDEQTYVGVFASSLDLLGRSIVAYPAATSNRSSFSAAKAETVMKNLVTYNATSSGTTGDGRVRTVTTAGISVESDGAGGNTIDIGCWWRPLLTTLQDVAEIGGGDFDLVKTGAAAWEFRWYSGQLGTDRSATVTFALQWGNMAAPVLRGNRIGEKTVAIVGGSGLESDRATAVRTGTNYHATTNAREVFVPYTLTDAAAILEDEGDHRLAELEARADLSFRVMQQPGSLYGSHYFLGDKVATYYRGTSVDKIINAVAVTLEPGRAEDIQVELGNP